MKMQGDKFLKKYPVCARNKKLEGKKLKTVRWDDKKSSLIYTTEDGEEIALWYPKTY